MNPVPVVALKYLQMGTTQCFYHGQWGKTPKNQQVFLEDVCANAKERCWKLSSLLYYLLFSSHRQQTDWDTQTWQRGAVNRPEKEKK